MPSISFIIPFYKKEGTLDRCLKSLFDQSVKDIEVILVLDGPSPEARKIAKRYSKHALSIIEIEHGGACAARNAGAEKATGTFLSFWDADCYIEPGTARVWLQAFELHPECDFVYSGYRFPEGLGAVPSRQFDPWLLRVGNYISAMFPIRREKAPKWDPSLESLQDWDFWLTAVENGSAGFYLQGYAFETESPDKDSISGKGCRSEVWLERVAAVKEKHGIPERELCVTTADSPQYGIALAKTLGADYKDDPAYIAHNYKTVLFLGFDPSKAAYFADIIHRLGKDCKKVLFWDGDDVQHLFRMAPAVVGKTLALSLNPVFSAQFCENKSSRETLEWFGFRAEEMMLPYRGPSCLPPIPDDFRVLVDVEDSANDFFQGIARAMPDVPLVRLDGAKDLKDYSVIVQFLNNRSLTENTKKCLLSGRRVVSNVDMPFCGYVPETLSDEKTRAAIVRALREAQGKGADMEAVRYYSKLLSPEDFHRRLMFRLSEMDAAREKDAADPLTACVPRDGTSGADPLTACVPRDGTSGADPLTDWVPRDKNRGAEVNA